MNKNFSMMFRLPAFEAAAPVGGGTATAAPPAPASAPAPAPAAAPASAPAPASRGWFTGLTRSPDKPKPPVVSAPPVLPPPSASIPAVPADARVQVLSDDKKTVLFEGTKTDAEAYVKANSPAPATAPAPAIAPPAAADGLARPFMGRADVKTQFAAEQLYLESQREAIRLHQQTRANEQNILDRDATIAGLKTELETVRKSPPMPDLTDEQLDALWKEKPATAAKYLKEKDNREAAVKAQRESAEKSVREQRELVQKVHQGNVGLWDKMSRDAKAFPMFNEIQDRMSSLYDDFKKQGIDFDFVQEAPRILYRMAMGDVFAELKGKESDVQRQAAEDARIASEAASRAAGGPGGGKAGGDGAAPDTRTPEQKSQEEWRVKMRATSKQNFAERALRPRAGP